MSHVARNERAPFGADRLAETGVFDRVLEAQATTPLTRRRQRTVETEMVRDASEAYNEETLSVALAHRAVVLVYL